MGSRPSPSSIVTNSDQQPPAEHPEQAREDHDPQHSSFGWPETYWLTEERVPPRWRHLDHYGIEAARHNSGEFYMGFARHQRRAFRGQTLRVGDPAPSFRLPTVDGDVLDLDAACSKGYVTIIFGSASAGPCINQMPDFDRLHRSIAETGRSLIFVYSKEAHPNEPRDAPDEKVLPSHRDMDHKIEQARAFRDELGLTMTICVDDLVDSVTRVYGGLPFFHTIVDPDGIVFQRSGWADVDLLEATFANISRAEKWTEEGRLPHLRGMAYVETRWLR
jgi:hypothetical protein